MSGKVHFDASSLPSTAYMTVRLQDTSYADAPAISIAEFESEIKSSPAYFHISYDPSKIDEGNEYSLLIQIYEDKTKQKLLFINDIHVGVITRKNLNYVTVNLKTIQH